MKLQGMIAAVLICTFGCVTTYQPKPTQNVRVISLDRSWGGWKFTQNGRELGLGDLAAATSEVPAARQEAESARRNQIGHIVLSILGGVALGVALGIAHYDEGWTDRNKASFGLAMGAIPLLGTAFVFESNMGVRALNAVNMYNDGLTGRQ